MSRRYSINWDLWTDQETAQIEKELSVSLLFYEKQFNDFDSNNETHTLELFEDIVENLISAYLLQSIINRVHTIDELLAKI